MAEVLDPMWRIYPGNQPKVTSIGQVLTTIISDLILVASPVWILRKTPLAPGLRFRLVSLFSISIAMTIAALAHVVVSLTIGKVWAVTCGAIEVFVTVFICNASVWIPAILRRFSDNETYTDSWDSTEFSTIIRL